MEDKNLSNLEGIRVDENSDVFLPCLAYFIMWISNNHLQSRSFASWRTFHKVFFCLSELVSATGIQWV